MGVRYCVGLAVDEPLRAAMLAVSEAAWQPTVESDGTPCQGTWVTELDADRAIGWPDARRITTRTTSANEPCTT